MDNEIRQFNLIHEHRLSHLPVNFTLTSGGTQIDYHFVPSQFSSDGAEHLKIVQRGIHESIDYNNIILKTISIERIIGNTKNTCHLHLRLENDSFISIWNNATFEEKPYHFQRMLVVWRINRNQFDCLVAGITSDGLITNQKVSEGRRDVFSDEEQKFMKKWFKTAVRAGYELFERVQNQT